MRKLLLITLLSTSALARPFTLDDEFKLRSIVDAKIAPDGSRVAYVVSTPNLSKNEHEGALYIVSSAGGAPQRLAESLHIFNTPLPAPRLRWPPDSSMLAVLATAGGPPQVYAVPLAGEAPHPLTDAAEGVSAFEWAPDGKSIAYITRDPMPDEEKRARADKSFVIHADAPDRPPRVYVKLSGAPPTSAAITPPSHYV